ncbi:MAG: ATP cone domain-containing protein [Candidatus Aenigmatarchaeota archaeon]
MVKVTKRDGNTEPFKAAKIEKSVRKAGASAAIARKIAALVEKNAFEGMSTDEIRRMVLEQLNRLDKKAADAYGEYQKADE